MNLSESIPGPDATLDDIDTWGLSYLQHLNAVTGDVLNRAILTEGISPAVIKTALSGCITPWKISWMK